jgi:cobaltochelatase CobN
MPPDRISTGRAPPLCALVCLAIALLTCDSAAAADAERIAILVSEADTYVVTKAVKQVELPSGVRVRLVTPTQLEQDRRARDFVASARVIVVDVMIRELVDHLLAEGAIAGKRVYAVRSSRDDARLAAAGVLFDDELRAYFDHLSSTNVANMIAFVAKREIDPAVEYGPLVELPTGGVHHPDADGPFSAAEEYLRWYRARKQPPPDAPRIGIMVYSTGIIEGNVEPLDRIIARLERRGFVPLCGFGPSEQVLESIMTDGAGDSRVDLIIAFSLKFRSALSQDVFTAVNRLGVPVINAISTYYSTIDEWRDDPRGLSSTEVAWAVANPELSGLIEPSVLAGKDEAVDHSTENKVFVNRLVRDNVEHLLDRVESLISLQRKPNSRKKVAILFYNNTPGKQNLGASYLNVFESLERILTRLEREGYRIDSRQSLSREVIRDLILKCGRNIGSWAPGELDDLVSAGRVARVKLATYAAWFAALPVEYRDGVREQWGSIEDSEVMVAGDEIIVPAIVLGNVVLMPEPSRGYSDDPLKLYHSPTLFPHHQYTAAYLWISEVFDADARIHLGTHGTHEWLPGKQAGLSTGCPPEVLGADTPSVYPYIVDDVGEGIQAKRRGRAVVVDHLVPPLKKAGVYQEYRRLAQMISQYRAAASLSSETAELKLARIDELARTLGILKDLGLESADAAQLAAIENYLVELGAEFMPYGLHTFGASPAGEPLTETVAAIREQNPDANRRELERALAISGDQELDRLVAGLAGRYVPAGKGNDPLRDPEAIPTGKNFYGFDPDRIPSQEAFELGKRAAEQLLADNLEREGRPPEKVAIVLWATETIRNEGINESTAMHLMGVEPVWDKSGRVTGVEVVPGARLGRPRIDVLINPSGLYRDLFPNLMELLDDAVQQAAVQTDVENLIALNSSRLHKKLVGSGMDAARAETLSRVRIFSEKPGNYGNRVVEVTGASGLWESDDEISRVYERHTGYAYGAGEWGLSAREALGQQLEQIDVAVHSISSALYGTMDNDDMFQYLGGLSLAVKNRAGQAPDTVLSLQRRHDEIEVEGIDKVLGREMRTRYLNPAWIEGMKDEDYAGAREMSNFVDYMWGWQVTVPSSVDAAKWEQTFDVYVEDKYDLEVKSFMDQANPWAYQGITARMFESTRKGYWDADEQTRQKLAEEYIESVLEHGISCSDNTCDNPLLHKEIIDVAAPLLDPAVIEQFRKAIEHVTLKTLEQQIAELEKMREQLLEGFEWEQMPAKVDGYRMEEIPPPVELTAEPLAGALWYAVLFAAGALLVFLLGMLIARRRRR